MHVFVLSCIFHVLVYWIIGIVVLTRTIEGILYFSDFSFSIAPTAQSFLVDPSSIYRAVYAIHRSMPFTVVYYSLFFLFPASLDASFISMSAALLIWNAGNCWLLHSIIRSEKIQASAVSGLLKDPWILPAAFLLVPWHWGEYYVTQTNLITCFFVLAGLHCYVSWKRPWAFFFWSLAFSFKIFPVCLLFLILYERPFKQFLHAAGFAILAQAPNLIMFALWPNLLPDYVLMNINMSSDYVPAYNPFSGSFSRNVADLFNLSILPTTIIVAIIILPLHLYVLLHEKRFILSPVDKIVILSLLITVVIPDFFNLHVLVFSGVYLVWMSSRTSGLPAWVKIPQLVPLFVMPLWFFFTYMSVFYLVPLVLVDVFILLRPARGDAAATSGLPAPA